MSASMIANSRLRETYGYNPEFLSARKSNCYSPILTPCAFAINGAPGACPLGAPPPQRHTLPGMLLLGVCSPPRSRTHISLYSHIPPAACYSHVYRRLSHPPPNMAWSVGRRGAMNPIGVWVNCYCIISSLGATTLESRPPVSRAS